MHNLTLTPLSHLASLLGSFHMLAELGITEGQPLTLHVQPGEAEAPMGGSLERQSPPWVAVHSREYTWSNAHERL